MNRYIAMLRGINVSGNNKIVMSELKSGIETIGFHNVVTYLNSGNVVYDSEICDKEKMTKVIEEMIKEQFGIDIPVFVIAKTELLEILRQAPDWWDTGDKAIYDNLIFLISPLNFENLYSEIGEPKKELEQIQSVGNAIFWSFCRKDYQKTNWWAKTANTASSNRITIRTAGTVKKLVEK